VVFNLFKHGYVHKEQDVLHVAIDRDVKIAARREHPFKKIEVSL
jgi:hypothetical protein